MAIEHCQRQYSYVHLCGTLKQKLARAANEAPRAPAAFAKTIGGCLQLLRNQPSVSREVPRAISSVRQSMAGFTRSPSAEDALSMITTLRSATASLRSDLGPSSAARRGDGLQQQRDQELLLLEKHVSRLKYFTAPATYDRSQAAI